jgi:hypothetical protein
MLNYTNILVKKYRHWDQLTREVTEIELHPNNMNRENRKSLSRL